MSNTNCILYRWKMSGIIQVRRESWKSFYPHSQKKQLTPLHTIASVGFSLVCSWVGWLNSGKARVFECSWLRLFTVQQTLVVRQFSLHHHSPWMFNQALILKATFWTKESIKEWWTAHFVWGGFPDRVSSPIPWKRIYIERTVLLRECTFSPVVTYFRSNIIELHVHS